MSDVDIPGWSDETMKTVGKSLDDGHYNLGMARSLYAALHCSRMREANLRTSLTATQEKLAAAEAARANADAISWSAARQADDLEAKLTTAQAQIEAARNEGLPTVEQLARQMSLVYEIDPDQTVKYVNGVEVAPFPAWKNQAWKAEFALRALTALKSTPPAPVRDDAWALRLIAFTLDERNQRDTDGYGRMHEEILDAFNTQDNSNE